MAGQRASGALGAGRFTDVRWVSETGSTNDDLMRLAEDGAPEGVVLVTDHQTSGKGRMGRTWTAPPGSSLLASVLLRPPAEVAGAVTMASAVSMASAITDVAGIAARVKWPNDLVWPGDGSAVDRKLAGILAEAAWPAESNIAAGWHEPAPDEKVVVVVGTGVNVNWPTAPPAELSDTATAVNQLAGREVERAALLDGYLHRLDGLYGLLVESRAPEVVLTHWRALSATVGRMVRIDVGADVVEGRAVDVTADGRLVVEQSSGERRVFATGDVVHLRNV